MKFIFLLLLTCLPSLVGADIFDVPPTDKSTEYLGHVFGSYLGHLYLGGSPNPVLRMMFEKLNIVVISLGTLIVTYIGVVSTVNTAQEGQAMGRKWSSIWIPMRAVLGMAVLVPTPASGYSVIQVTVMWIILQGIGAADKIWDLSLSHLEHGVSTTKGITAPNNELHVLRQQAEDLSEQTMKAAVCLAAVEQLSQSAGFEFSPTGKPLPFESSDNALMHARKLPIFIMDNQPSPATFSADTQQATFTGTVFAGANHPQYRDICGRFEISGHADKNQWDPKFRITGMDVKATAQRIYRQKAEAVKMMIENALPLGRAIVQQVITPRSQKFGGYLVDGEQPSSGGFKQQAIDIYVNRLSELVKPCESKSWVADAIRAGKQSGWISAGSFYYVLNQAQNNQLFPSVTQSPPNANGSVPRCDPQTCNGSATQADLKKLPSFLDHTSERNYLASRLRDAKLYYDNDATRRSNRLGIALPDHHSEHQDYLNNLWKFQADVTEWLMNEMTSDTGDALLGQAEFGGRLMLGSEITWIALIYISGLVVSLGASGTQLNPAMYSALVHKLLFAGVIAIAIVGVVWVAGATLAIYVPLIPYMMFTVGAMGWMIMVVEAIVAAPIMTLGFILPSNEELGKTSHGFMLLMNVTLRPTLMLFGFILATRVYQAVVNLVHFGLSTNYRTLDVSGSLLGWVAGMVLYATFVVALANKCFALIYTLPDKILRWIGGQPEHTDASQELHQAKSGVGKGADTAQKPAAGYAIGRFAQVQEKFQQQAKAAGAAAPGGNAGGQPADGVQGHPNANGPAPEAKDE